MPELHPDLRGLLAREGWAALTSVQEAAMEPLLARRHALLLAPTGHGKTEAALLPVLHHILSERTRLEETGQPWPSGFKVLYVTPLRALNRDLMRRLEGWCEQLRITVGVRHGDTSQAERSRQSRRPPDLLITTPETLQLLLYGDTLRRHLATVRFVIVDEVHDLAQSERGAQLMVALERVEEVVGQPPRLREVPARERTCPASTHARDGGGFQRIGLSATVADDEATAAFLAGGRDVDVVRDSHEKKMRLQVVHPEPEAQDVGRASELLLPVAAAAQLRTVRKLVQEHERVVVFHNTRDGAELMASRSALLDAERPPLLGLHHGSLSAEHRVDVETRFRDGDIRGLVATSSLELGIDVGAIDHVVQVQSPRSVARLVQRLGRAGHRVGAVSAGTLVSSGPEDHLECVAVARMAGKSELEPLRIREAPLVVLANQIVAMTNEYRDLDPGWCRQVVTRAAPFADLDEGLFQTCWDTLLDVRTLFESEQAPGRMGRSGRGRKHFLEHLSLIPDEKKYRVVDEATKRSIGTVDDAYVAAAMQPGEQVVMAGRAWRVLEVETDAQRVRVTSSRELGAIPQWSGQQLPVSFELAQAVARLRGTIAASVRAGDPERTKATALDASVREATALDATALNASVREATALDATALDATALDATALDATALDATALDATALDATVSPAAPAASRLDPDLAPAAPPIIAHLEAGLQVGTDRLVTLDAGRAAVVAGVALGTRGNETLGRLTAALLHQRTGVPVAVASDAYRIHLKVPSGVGPADVEAVWRTIDAETLDLLLGMVLRDQPVLRHHLVHVAKHFGALPAALDPTRFTRATMDALWQRLALQEETLNRLLHDRFDVDAVAIFLHRLERGGVEVVHQAMGPLSRLSGDEARGHIAPRSDQQLVDAVQRRIDDSDIMLVCTNCRSRLDMKVRDVARKVRCRRCGSNAVACLRPWQEEDLMLLGNQKLSADERRERQRIIRNGQIMAGFGSVAARCLVARGVGPDTAARILQKVSDPASPSFWREILNAELEYARTQAFWR